MANDLSFVQKLFCLQGNAGQARAAGPWPCCNAAAESPETGLALGMRVLDMPPGLTMTHSDRKDE
jgi:hypothetical protein